MENMEEKDTQRALSAAPREHFNYTQWRREYFDDMTPEEFEAAAEEWAKAHQSDFFIPNKTTLAAIEEAESGCQQCAHSVDELFEDLNADD